MAVKTNEGTATKTPKAALPIAQKVKDQLTKATLQSKITKDELANLGEHITKLSSLL